MTKKTLTTETRASITRTQANTKTSKIQSVKKHSNLISYDPAWHKINLSPSTPKARSLVKALPPDTTVLSLRETDQLLRALNEGWYQADGSLWRCQARVQNSLQPPQKETQLLKININGANCSLEAEIPLALRESIEKMIKPFQLEELPLPVALGVMSLKLQPFLNQLLLAPANIINYNFDTKKSSVKQKNLKQETNLCIKVEALPIDSEGAKDNSREAFNFQIYLSHHDAKPLRSALRQIRKTRQYPPNLHATWNFYAEETTISIQEFRALEQGDVLILN